VYQLATPATLDTTGGSGQVYIYVDTQGNLTAAEAVQGSPALTCTGCSVLFGVAAQFPSGSIPIGLWSVTSGSFSSGGSDERANLSAAPVISAGSNISITQTNGSITISAVDASGLSSGSGSGSGSSSGGSASAAGSGSELQYNNYGSFGAVTGSSVSGGTVRLGVNPPASATQSVLGIGQAITGGNSNGTLLSINAPAGFSGDVLNVLSNGSELFHIDSYGQIIFSNYSILNSGQLRLNAPGYSTMIGLNYTGAPNSTGRIMILGQDHTNQMQFGTGFSNNSFILNGLGKLSAGTIAPVPASTASGADLLIQNATPSTGSTLVQIQAGAGQTGDLTQWLGADGTVASGVTAQGALRNLPSGTQPACAVVTRGMFWHQQGGSGVTDSVSVCAKDATDTYAWRTIF